MRNLVPWRFTRSSAGSAKGNRGHRGVLIFFRSHHEPPTGIRTSFMPIEFVTTSGSAWSAGADLDFSFGEDKNGRRAYNH